MFVNRFISLLLTASPFFEAYTSADYLGKLIFISLIATSIVGWSIFIYKFILTRRAKRNSSAFYKVFSRNKNNPLHLEGEIDFKNGEANPFYELYLTLKKYSIEILTKNRRFSSTQEENSYLSPSDIDCIGSHLGAHIDQQTLYLEKNLFILSTIVGLAPLLGLLGTVWGILITFSGMQTHSMTSTNQVVLGGLSLALTTTVLGLLSAMPALIAYNYLKNAIRSFETEMEGIATEMLSSVEMQYRKVNFE